MIQPKDISPVPSLGPWSPTRTHHQPLTMTMPFADLKFMHHRVHPKMLEETLSYQEHLERVNNTSEVSTATGGILLQCHRT